MRDRRISRHVVLTMEVTPHINMCSTMCEQIHIHISLSTTTYKQENTAYIADNDIPENTTRKYGV